MEVIPRFKNLKIGKTHVIHQLPKTLLAYNHRRQSVLQARKPP
uniref:Uncharacterized protein n=1 Tax=Rhizophora mucronata TaxID=61149 RepID=A0A2P2MQ74_RHIMU